LRISDGTKSAALSRRRFVVANGNVQVMNATPYGISLAIRGGTTSIAAGGTASVARGPATGEFDSDNAVMATIGDQYSQQVEYTIPIDPNTYPISQDLHLYFFYLDPNRTTAPVVFADAAGLTTIINGQPLYV
jgi:hypothetical protein